MAITVHPPRIGRSSGRTIRVLARFSLVVAVHVAVLLGLARLDPGLRKTIEPVLVSLITPPKPAEPAPPPPPPALKPQVKAPPKSAPIAPKVAAPVDSSPATITDLTPLEVMPAAPQPPAAIPAEAVTVSQPPPTIAVAKPPAPVTPPRFDAAYLNNPRPEYPRVARRMGEHGKVMLHVYVSAAGTVEKVEVRASSGSARLDQAARDAVERWKFVPARQGDTPVAAWVLVPITFVLEG